MVRTSLYRVFATLTLVPLIAGCVVDLHIHVDDHGGEPVRAETQNGFEILQQDDPGVVGDALWRSWEWSDRGRQPEAARPDAPFSLPVR